MTDLMCPAHPAQPAIHCGCDAARAALDDAVERENRAALDYANAVAAEVYRLRIQRDARARLAAETTTGRRFDAALLGEVLDREPPPPDRVAGLVHHDAGTLLVAKRKVGKTTFGLNLLRCLATGDPFLNALDVRKVTGRTALLNYEVSASQAAAWAEHVGIPRDALMLVNLRGCRNPLADPDDRAALASLLHAAHVETVLTDPFSRAFTGANQNDTGEVSAWLADLDRFVRGEVGAVDSILTAHTGWGDDERSRGSSGLEDWPDSIIVLTADDDDGRYLRAFGRDVDLPESPLVYDQRTRTLTLVEGGGTRREANTRVKATALMPAVWSYVRANSGCSGSSIAAAVEGNDALIRKARDLLTERGHLTTDVRRGKGGGIAYFADTDRPPPGVDWPDPGGEMPPDT